MKTTIGTDTRRGVGQGRWWALGALVLSALVLGLDMTILVTAIPTLSEKLGASTDQLQWILAAYTLTLAGLLIPAGVLADRLGRRRMLFVGLVIFGIASVAASQMTTATGLIAMRAVMGIGGAIILPLSLAILPTIFSEQERPRAIGIASAATFLGLPLGPLVAGYLLTHFAWGSVFLINAPVVIIALLGAWFFVPESRDPNAPRLDVVGAALAVAGVTSLVYGIIEQPARGWTDSLVLGGLICGGVLLTAFTVWELRRRSPLVDLRLFLSRRFALATLGFVTVGFAMNGVLFVIGPYLQLVQGNDAQGTGIRLLPMIGAMLVGALSTARLTARLGARVMVAAGFVITSAGLLLLSRAGSDTGFGLVAGAEAVMGLGIAFAMIPAVDAILSVVPENETGGGTALTRTLQNVGGSFGVAIMGSILNAAYRGQIDSHLGQLPGRARSAAEGSVAGAAEVAHHLPAALGGPLLRAAKDAYVSGMAEVLLVSAAVMLSVAILAAILMPSRATTVEDDRKAAA